MTERKPGYLLVFIAITVMTMAALSQPAGAEEGKFRREYSGQGVFARSGGTEALEIVITRWTTDEERSLLVNTLAVKGQNETLKEMRDQEVVGFVRRRNGRDIQGMPSVRLHYAREFDLGNGKKLIVLITERPVGSFEAQTTTLFSDANMAGIRLDLTVKGDKETGTGVVYRAIKVGFDDNNKLKIESQAKEPLRLTKVERKK